MPKSSKLFISTAIPYPNAEPHLGFGLEITQADVLARYYREKGDKDVFFLTGTDENSLKNVLAAEKSGLATREFVDRISPKFKRLKDILNLSFDDFIRTTEKRHVDGVEKLWEACKADIYKKKYRGLYCVGCETFYLPKDLPGGLCPEHKVKPEAVEEENYFFRLSKYEKWLYRLVASGKVEVIPEKRKNEVLSFIKHGLEDFSISRSAERAKGWGIKAPGDPSQVIWVWFDALANYITALGYAKNASRFRDFWQNNKNIIHLIGKGVSRFHAVYWPAMLKSAGLNLPKKILVHGYITVGGEKMSKSLGNFISPNEVVEKYGAEPVRYYLLREIPSGEDGDFSDSRFRERYNADLANGLGNFVSRVSALAKKFGSYEIIPRRLESNVKLEVKRAGRLVDVKIGAFRLNEALAAVWDLVFFGDRYINRHKVWATEKPDEQIRQISNLIFVLDNIAGLLTPFLPETSRKIRKNFPKPQRLFPRL